MRFKLYISKSEYTERLNLINEKMGFPSKKYQKYVGGRLRSFTFEKIMTRTWAEENPRLTEQNQYALPVEKEMEKDFTGLVEYDKNWFPEAEIELK